LPRAQWAVVYWDDLSVLVVRRISEHARLIAEHEYRFLRPNLPPGEFMAGGRARGIDEIRGFSREVQRCRRERPHDERCAAAERVVVDLDRALAEAVAARSLARCTRRMGSAGRRCAVRRQGGSTRVVRSASTCDLST